ncbi:hypothetical protein NQ318_020256 [Aromia moschata]|uniref:Rab3 GTPase-activating protein catalytic subunit n=1 Tax=Aromia moschata TaxID=1265417 RepID=A0AAV8ZBN5_9CUCU|nr:hypothetical protein NQ318_020256 [Aromia moschata]
MNEEVDETEFYHQDFTTASEWEIFTARIEEIINQWKTEDQKDELIVDSQSIWEVKSEKLTFVDFDFNLSRYRKKVDSPDSSESTDESEKQNKNPIDTLYDFELYDERNTTDASCLSSWYGLNELIVLTPSNNIGITSESKIKLLLSSAYVVMSNLNCEMPIFIQIREKWQDCYLGVFEGEGIRTNFEMVHLRRGPSHGHYLSGLLDLFKTKIMSPCTIENVLVSAQLSFSLMDFGNFIWKQDLLNSDRFDVEVLFVLPFGVTVDPVNAIVLKTTWSHVSDNVIVDSESYSDFEPLAAPKWSCLAKMTNDPVCLLGDCLIEFFQNLNNNVTVYDVLGDFAASPLPESNPLDLLTEPAVPTFSSLLSRAARNSISNSLIKQRKGNAPISEAVLVPLLYFFISRRRRIIQLFLTEAKRTKKRLISRQAKTFLLKIWKRNSEVSRPAAQTPLLGDCQLS